LVAEAVEAMSAPRSRREIRGGGFTLLEIVIVLMIVGIISAIALARVGNDPVMLSTQVDQLAGDIRYVQALAMTQGQRYRINLSATGYTLTLADAGGTLVPHPVTGSTAQTNWNSGITIALPPTNLPNNLVAFDGRGIPYTDNLATAALAAASTASIMLSKGGVSQSITITPQTGRVTP
jgi:prepilin-type N-terminal cleavage/methylation domain-containing protein